MRSSIIQSVRNCLLLAVLFLVQVDVHGQVFWSENFGTNGATCDQGTSAALFASSNGIWNVSDIGTQAPYANKWYISSTETGKPNGVCNDPTGGCIIDPVNNNNRTLHVGTVSGAPTVICPSGDCGASYDPGGFQNPAVATNRRVESPVINCTGRTNIQISFLYMLGDNGDLSNDRGTVEYFDGTAWQTVDIPTPTFSCGTGSVVWTQKILSLPATASNNPNVRIGFSWTNDEGGVGIGSPSFALDEIQLINVPPPSNSDFSCSDTDLVICAGNSVDYTAITTGASAWGWIFVGATPGNATGQNPTGIVYPNPGTFDVYMIAFNNSGTDTVIKQITVNACVPPVASFAASDTVFCQRGCIDFIDLSLNDPDRWIWQFQGADPVSASNLQNPSNICYPNPGTFSVTLVVSNLFGSDTVVKTIVVEDCPLPVVNFSASSTQACNNQCINFTDLTQFTDTTSTWTWYFPGAVEQDFDVQNPVCVRYAQDGLYDVQLLVTNQYGSDTLTLYSYIRIESVPSAFACPDTSMEFGESYQLSAGGGATYSWSPGAGLDATNISNPIATPTATTTYTCSISDGSGCTTTRQVTVTILFDNNLYVPNSFSPNADGRNDYLFVRGNNFSKIRFSVFDRWGELIFETEDPLIGWDGRYKGKDLNSGVFTWVATLIYDNQTPLTTTGTVTLLR